MRPIKSNGHLTMARFPLHTCPQLLMGALNPQARRRKNSLLLPSSLELLPSKAEALVICDLKTRIFN